MTSSLLSMLVVILSLVLAITHTTYSYNLDETIKVYYVEAPLLKGQFGDLLGNFNAYHSGVFFLTQDTNEEYVVDYLAYPSILASFFPNVIYDNDTHITEISWISQGMNQIKQGYNGTYWTRQQYVMSITGEQFQKYLCWVPVYNQSYPYYTLFDIRDGQTEELYIPSSICNDFVWASFQTLYDLGAEVTISAPPSRDFITLYVSEQPQPIEYPNEPSNWAQITKFYDNLIFKPNETADELVEHLITLFNGRWFLYIDGNYYNMSLDTTLTNPKFTYSPQQMPSGSRDPSTVNYVAKCLPPPIEEGERVGIGGGWIFIITIVCGASAYLLIGFIYNAKVNHKSGVDAIPNKEQWVGLGGLISDGFYYLIHKIKGTTVSAAYQTI